MNQSPQWRNTTDDVFGDWMRRQEAKLSGERPANFQRWMTAMFVTLENLSKTLPRPKMNGNSDHDDHVRDRYIANAKILRSEAFACIGRSIVASVRNGWHQLTASGLPTHTRQA